MNQYFLIENNQIIEGPIELPDSFGIFSNLALRTAEELQSIGFYPLVDTQPVYDAATQSCTRTGYMLGSSSVTADYTVSDLPLSTVKSNQISDVSAACREAIYSGFTSDALGGTFTYPTSDTDQTNLLGSYSASLDPGIPSDWTTPFWCADASGNWALRPHSATQIRKAYTDGMAQKLAYIQKNATLAAEIIAAPTNADVVALKW